MSDMTHPPEPIPDLEIRPACPRCGGSVEADRTELAHYGWCCDHCRITWTPDGTGGQQA